MLLQEFIVETEKALGRIYPEREARSIAGVLCEDVLGVKPWVSVTEPSFAVPADKEAQLQAAVARLLSFEPVQYVTGKAWFYGRPFKVNHDVLIPRPETEELVREALGALEGVGAPRILDLCTGSGCLAWTLAAETPGARVFGMDISPAALAVARSQVVGADNVPVFIEADVLDTTAASDAIAAASGGAFDLIVCNPPYILDSQRSEMEPNVLEHEPALALFVPDDDPLRFYRAIAPLSRRLLKPGGRCLAEINDMLGPQTRALFMEAGFRDVRIIHDLSGRDRIVAFSLGGA